MPTLQTGSSVKTSKARPVRIERLLVFAVWASVVWLLALLLHRVALSVLLPPLPPAGPSGQENSAYQSGTTALQKIFGGADQQPLPLQKADIQLVGFIQAGQDSVVAVRIRNEPTRYLSMRQADADGWRLESVRNGEIEISRMGELYRLASYPSRTGLGLAID
jgi:hypothetical protein